MKAKNKAVKAEYDVYAQNFPAIRTMMVAEMEPIGIMIRITSVTYVFKLDGTLRKRSVTVQQSFYGSRKDENALVLWAELTRTFKASK